MGPKYGKHLNEIRQFLQDLDSKAGMTALAEGAIRFTTKDGTEVLGQGGFVN